jgi:hypothetical protein
MRKMSAKILFSKKKKNFFNLTKNKPVPVHHHSVDFLQTDPSYRRRLRRLGSRRRPLNREKSVSECAQNTKCLPLVSQKKHTVEQQKLKFNTTPIHLYNN